MIGPGVHADLFSSATEMKLHSTEKEVLHSSSTLLSLGCDQVNEFPGAKERVQFLLKNIGKEEFIFWCLQTEKTSKISDSNSEPMTNDKRLEIVQFQLDQIIKVRTVW